MQRYIFHILTILDYNRKLMVDENVLGATICFLWKETDHDCVYDRYSKDYIKIIISNFQNSPHVSQKSISTVPSLGIFYIIYKLLSLSLLIVFNTIIVCFTMTNY